MLFIFLRKLTDFNVGKLVIKIKSPQKGSAA
jgi:hypothetical protein